MIPDQKDALHCDSWNVECECTDHECTPRQEKEYVYESRYGISVLKRHKISGSRLYVQVIYGRILKSTGTVRVYGP
jgi:hypothetical protein